MQVIIRNALCSEVTSEFITCCQLIVHFENDNLFVFKNNGFTKILVTKSKQVKKLYKFFYLKIEMKSTL